MQATSIKPSSFSDEKVFIVEESLNRQNDRLRSSKKALKLVPRGQRVHHFASVMVWSNVHYDDVMSIRFCEKGVKTSAAEYHSIPFRKSVFGVSPGVCAGA